MQGSFATTTIVTVVAIASVFGFFMIFRFLVWWYFGIDEHLANQKKIISLLEQSSTAQSIASVQMTQPQTHRTANPLTARKS